MSDPVSVPVTLPVRGGWRDRAACRGLPVELFFPPAGAVTSGVAARKVCAVCTVRSECFDVAVENDERFGTWGGFTGRELRRAVRRRRMRDRTIWP